MNSDSYIKNDYLANLLKNKESYNSYIFINSYLPAVMTREGYDYVDAYLVARGSLSYFFYENKALERKNNKPYSKEPYYFSCIYVNDNGKISFVIKRKIQVESIVDTRSFNELIEKKETGMYRLFNSSFIEDSLLVKKITSTDEFEYYYIEKKKDNIIQIFKLHISNCDDTELIKNYQGKVLYKGISFHKAEFVYDEKDNFIDLKIIE